jgi:hypothetical protein
MTMVVHAGKAEVFVRQVTKLFDGLIDGNVALLNLLQ